MLPYCVDIVVYWSHQSTASSYLLLSMLVQRCWASEPELRPAALEMSLWITGTAILSPSEPTEEDEQQIGRTLEALNATGPKPETSGVKLYHHLRSEPTVSSAILPEQKVLVGAPSGHISPMVWCSGQPIARSGLGLLSLVLPLDERSIIWRTHCTCHLPCASLITSHLNRSCSALLLCEPKQDEG